MGFSILNGLTEEEEELRDYLSEDEEIEEGEEFQRKFSEIETPYTLDKSFPKTVVVVGVPKVPKEKIDKMTGVFQKILKDELLKKGVEDPTFKVDMPVDENGATRGFCFLTFSSGFIAEQATKFLNGFPFDSKHIIKLTSIDKLDEIVNRDETYKLPVVLLGFTRESFRWWLHDERGREQFVVRYKEETEIFWHDPVEHEPVLIYNGHRERAGGKRVWTDFRVQWSPQGSYLATFHKPGIALWAGPNFEKKVRFEHKDVKQIDFSPNEEYVLTWDGSPAKLKNEKAVRIWKAITGELIASFATPSETPRGGEFPLFLWSHDDSYIAKMGEDALCVYELPSMSLLTDEKSKRSSFKYPLKRFDWSPGANILSIWTPEINDVPGKLLLIDVPSRKELACKNVYSVEDASMHWQSKGDYLALRTVIQKKTGKKGRKTFTQLEIFRMREKNIPVDIIRIEDVKVQQFHWEEGFSKRFALVVEDDSKQPSLRFYRVLDRNEYASVILLETFNFSAVMNYMKWSPQGGHFILLSKSDYVIMFCALNDNDKVEVLHKDEHLMVNDLRWSSCGRFVTTAVNAPMYSSGATSDTWRFSSECGFIIWTFQGKMQFKSQKDKFYQFLWRPHPPSLLPDKKIEEIKKNQREYSKKFDAIDEKLKLAQRDAYTKARRQEMEDFEKHLETVEEWKLSHPLYEEWKLNEERFDQWFDWHIVEEVREEELEVREEMI